MRQGSSGRLPVPLSMKRTLETGRKFVPLSSSSSPPSTEQEVRLTDSMTGSSWAERWAVVERNDKCICSQTLIIHYLSSRLVDLKVLYR